MTNEEEVSRRGFLKGAGVVLASAAASFTGANVFLYSLEDRRQFKTPEIQTTLESFIEPTPQPRAIPVKGYERFSEHDERILDAVAEWNNAFFHIKNFTPLNPKLVKAMALVETAGHPQAWNYDPLQMANQGDTGLDDLRRVDPQHLLPRYPELQHIRHTPRINNRWAYDAVPEGNRINADLSIRFGTRYLFQKAFEFKRNGKKLDVSMRDWDDAAARYNGGGDPSYLAKIAAIL